MNRRKFLTTAASVAASAAVPAEWARAAAAKSPNIVLMLVDDLGWGDLGCYGDKFHETPVIDKLCSESLRFTNAYAAAPVCSPSRAGILTGQNPARLHLTQWIPGSKFPHKRLVEADNLSHLPEGVPTIASELKKLGYSTGAIGKWHLGDVGFLPENFGFDVNVAGDNHGHPGKPHEYFGPFQYHNLTGGSERDYLTDVLSDRVDAYLESVVAQRKPFFLYFAEYAVHLPLQAKAKDIAKYAHKNGGAAEPDPTYAAMIASVDHALQRLRTKLDALGVAENTVILLTSDNGGVGYQGRSLHRIADNGPFRAGKGFLYEGGVREPLIVNWPGVTKAGTTCDVPVTGTDFLSTLLSIAGGQGAIATDGLDITPLFRGATSLARTDLCWHYPHYSDQGGTPTGAIREGDWKLIDFFEDGHLELYNLAEDPREQYDFASSFDGKARDLHAKLVNWRTANHALMPTPNRQWNDARLNQRSGPAGCSATTASNCVED